MQKSEVRGMSRFNVLAVVSLENGVEYFAVVESGINSSHVLKMFSALRRYGQNAIVFTDNTSHYRSNQGTEAVQKLNCVVKGHFRRHRFVV